MASIKRIKTIFQFRRSTTQEWELNKDIIPDAGEPCYDLDLGTLKVGDGKTTYENLRIVGSAVVSEDGSLVTMEDIKTDMAALQTLIGESSVEEQINEAMAEAVKTSDLEVLEASVEVLASQANTYGENIAEIKIALEQKPDDTDLSSLSDELKTYVDEQIETIDIIKIDDGEI